ncbi:MAG: FAD-binding protein, partial [Flammeovirgaceae bacterium]|nr:FAD-binding protein [Flammeovirgaceae bacterium]MDW8288571.1 FAD-binding protein [Flammeovirgaceae bacterium]
KRGDFRRILEIFVAHGANPLILAESHPHIGTNKLPKIVEEIRNSILLAGGEVYFEQRVIDFLLEKDEINGVMTHTGEKIMGEAVILATGHSARDIFHLLKRKKIALEPKPYALGIRIEHPQQLIDSIQYHCEYRGDYLPAAAYALVSQVMYQGKEKGVFSFCMCPGGFIVPSATAPGEVVVNGMSPSRRDSKFANSGIVVQIDKDDLKDFYSYEELAGVAFQQSIEQKACQLAGGTQTAPAQRMLDFVQKKVSTSLLPTSYQPGLASVSMDEVLPPPIAYRLRKAFEDFGKKMKGYLTNEAQIVGVESRTSSPVRIPRNPLTLEHPQIKRLFPCGEGAGYAGGIASAAMDGERCAEAVKKRLSSI